MRTCFLVILILGLLIVTACKKNQFNEPYDHNVVAYINNRPIFYPEIDKIVKQELFDELNRVYAIRKAALSDLISQRLIELEAEKRNISTEKLIKIHYSYHYTDSLKDAFIHRNNLESGVIELTRGIDHYDLDSERGRFILDKEIRQYLKQLLIDSLLDVNKISVLLEPPISPDILTNNLRVYYRGNVDSKISFIEISDYECDACRSSEYLFYQLYKKYKDKVKFGFTNYGSYVSLSALASESAARQNKFWEFHDSIFKMPVLPDSQDVYNLAKKLSLNLNKFKSDVNSKSLHDSIWSNIQLINKYGVYGTPTLLINNKFIFNSKSMSEIEEMLNREITKNQ